MNYPHESYYKNSLLVLYLSQSWSTYISYLGKFISQHSVKSKNN